MRGVQLFIVGALLFITVNVLVIPFAIMMVVIGAKKTKPIMDAVIAPFLRIIFRGNDRNNPL